MATAPAVRPTKRLNVFLWIAQGVLALLYGLAGAMKVSQPIPKLAAAMGWPGALPEWAVRSIGAAELAGAVGLILPLATGMLPRLTQAAAIGLVVLQVCAMVFHTSRGELQVLPINLVLLAPAVFVAWGRRTSATL